MNSFRIMLSFIALALVNYTVAAEPEMLGKLDKALEAVSNFEQGNSAGPLVEIERIVFTLPADSELRGTIEQKLLDALESATTNDGKRFLCSQLRVVGTAACVSHLEKLLTDPPVSHAARYALGSLEAPEASEALHRGLAKTSALLQAGIVNTLRDRGYRKAKPDFVKLLGSTDTNVARAAARALGRLGGADAIGTLTATRAGAGEELGMEIDNALLHCAEQLVAEDKKAEAAAIYKTYYLPEQSSQFRFAALRGLVLTRGEMAVELLVEAIRGGDADLARNAISLVSTVEGEKATEAFAGVLESLPAEAQVLLLRALGARGDVIASKAVIRETKNEHEAVRIAALEALGSVGGASEVSVLTETAAAAGGMEKEVARASLTLLSGDDVDAKLMQSINAGSSAVRVEVIHAIAGRGATQAVSELSKTAKDDDSPVRREAIEALGMLAGQSDLPAMLELAIMPKEASDRSVIEEAIGKALLRIEDKDNRARPVLDALANVSTEARPTLLRLLGKSGSSEALRVLRAALKSPIGPIKDAAVRTISEWPDASAGEDLLNLIGSNESQAHKEVALQGYVRMAEMSEDPTAMYVRVLGRVEGVNDKKLVLSELGLNSDSPEAIELALGWLDDKYLAPSAGLAALRIAHRLRTEDEPLARATLKKVIETVQHEDVRQRAQEVINDMDKFEGHILQWVGVGPFTEKGKDGEALYRTVLEPEKPGAEGVKWQPVTKGIGSWDINLEAAFGGFDHCAAYLRTRVWSETQQDALLEVGSDDGIKVWLNGEVVHDHWTHRGAAPRQDRVEVQLAKGSNELMLKVVDHEGGWVVACRLRKPDGTPLDGLKVEAQ